MAQFCFLPKIMTLLFVTLRTIPFRGPHFKTTPALWETLTHSFASGVNLFGSVYLDANFLPHQVNVRRERKDGWGDPMSVDELDIQ